jgi:inorganic triphosphatase YgiF
MPATPVASEVEAKLIVRNASDLSALAQLSLLGPFSFHPLHAVRLHSVYLDTPERILAHHGVALRARRQQRRWEMTAKWFGRVVGDVHERPELTVPLRAAPRAPFLVEDETMRLHLGALCAGRPLEPILLTDIHRRRVQVRRRDASAETPPLAEMALDRVQLKHPHRTGVADRYLELEIELVDGDRNDLRRLAEMLRRAFDLRPSPESKFSRGLRLYYDLDPSLQREAPVAAAEPLEIAGRKIVARHLRALRANDPGTRLGADPEALHDMRVASRRLRAALRTFGDGLPTRGRRTLEEELRWLRRCLGTVRDLDVQLERVAASAAAAPAGQRRLLEPFQAHLRRERETRRAEMLAALDSARYRNLLLGVERFALGGARRRPPVPARAAIGVAGQHALQRSLRRLLKRGKAVHQTPNPEDLHAVRIRAKQLRYILEFLRDITGKPGQRSVKRLVRLQDVLGAYHDAVVAADWVRVYAEKEGARCTPGMLLALGSLVGQETQAAEQRRAQFGRAWRKFTCKRARGDFKALLTNLQTAADAGDAAPAPLLRAAPQRARRRAATTGEPRPPRVVRGV